MTIYVAPRVNVYQEYASMSVSASTAQFIPIVIGPCYNVIDESADEVSSHLQEYTGILISNVYFPSLKVGSVVDPYTVRVRYKDPLILYKADFDCTTITENGITVNFSTITVTDIVVGDHIDIKDSSDNTILFEDVTVMDVDIVAKTIRLNRACVTATTTLEVDVYRSVENFTLTKDADGVYTATYDESGDDVSFSGGILSIDTNDSKLSLTPIYIIIGGNACKCTSANLYVGYRSRVTSLNRIIELSTVAEAEQTLGLLDPRNPLGQAISIIFANMTTIPVKVFGTVDDTLVSWEAAKDAISIDADLYTIVPLTQDSSILEMFKNHAVEASSPEVAMFRICIGSAALTLDDTIARGVQIADGAGVISVDDDTILDLLTDSTAEFLTDGVLVGDTLRLYDSNDLPSEFIIADVLGGNRIKCDPRTPFQVNGGASVDTINYITAGINDGYITATDASLIDDEATLVAGNQTGGGVTEAYCLFDNITVAKDATTTAGYIKLKASVTQSGAVALRIYGVVATPDTAPPASKSELTTLLSTSLTTAYVDWAIASLAPDTVYTSPDIKAIVDEMVAESTWVRGGNLMFVIRDHSSDANHFATFYSFDAYGGINKPELDLTFPAGSFIADSTYNYEIIHQMSIGEMATAYSQISQSLATTTRSNMVNIYPTTCYCTGFTEELPGYYLAAAVAGLGADIPGHQSFTRSSVAGITRLGDLGLFNNTQLNTIAGGGTFLFTQANENAVPIIRHQLTTNMASIEFRELSFVRNFDYVSTILKGVLEYYIGKYNITPTNMSIIGNAINGTLKSLTLATQPVIGSPVMSYKVVSVTQLESQRDRVEVVVNVLFPYALNYIGLHIVSQ